jgi:hypothetical protein
MFICQDIPISHINLTTHTVGMTTDPITGGMTAHNKTIKETLLDCVNIFKTRIGAYDRPVRDLIWKARYHIFGMNASGYQFISVLFFGLLIWMIYAFCERFFNSSIFGILASLFYIFSPPLWQLIPCLEEISVLQELLVIVPFYLFLGYYLKTNTQAKVNTKTFLINNLAILFFSLLAIQTKGSAKIILPVLFTFVLIDDRKRIRSYVWLFLALALISAPVLGSIYNLFAGISVPHEIQLDARKIYKLLFTNPDYTPIFGSSLFSSATLFLLVPAGLGMFFMFFKRRLTKLNIFFIEDLSKKVAEKRILIFVSLWFIFSVLLYIGYPPESEPRYLSSCLVPFAMLLVFFIRFLYFSFKRKYRYVAGLIIIILSVMALAMNAHKVYQVRAAHWSYSFAQEKVKYFIEKEEAARNSIIYGDVELVTVSQIDSTNTYVLRIPGNDELKATADKMGKVYVVKCYTPLDPEKYDKKIQLLTIINGESDTYFDRLKNLIYKKLTSLKKPAVYRNYYVYKLVRD